MEKAVETVEKEHPVWWTIRFSIGLLSITAVLMLTASNPDWSEGKQALIIGGLGLLWKAISAGIRRPSP